MAEWRSRIVGNDDVSPQTLLANPLNWRVHPKGQQVALESALDAIGWIQQVIVNRTTGHMIDGHARVMLAVRRKEPKVPVLYVELTEDEERAALASLDPLSAMAVTDPEQLFAVVDGLQTGHTAFDQFLADQRTAAGSAQLAPQASGEAARTTRDKNAVVKVVIPATDLALVEKALAATGQISRDAALTTLCRSYLEHESGADGQHQPGPQVRAAAVATAAPTEPAAGDLRDARRNRKGVGAGL